MPVSPKIVALALATSTLALAAPAAQAAPIFTQVGVDLSTVDHYDVSFMGGTIRFTDGIGFPSYFAVETNATGAVRTVFGNPSVDFTDRGYPFYDAFTLGGFSAFSAPALAYASNGDNFLGLRVESGGNFYYGFAFTTNNVLNSFAFESSPNTGILGVTAAPAAVPEPATWALMITGFGLVGAAMRGRRTAATA